MTLPAPANVGNLGKNCLTTIAVISQRFSYQQSKKLLMLQLFNGDCIKELGKVADASVNLALTSPPYHLKKEYELETTTEEFKTLIDSVFWHVRRVLKPGGYFVVNFGDAF